MVGLQAPMCRSTCRLHRAATVQSGRIRAWLMALAILSACLGWPLQAAARTQAPSDGGTSAELTAARLSDLGMELTGVAISPVLFLGGLGAYQYWAADPGDNPHGYAQPWIWVSLLALGMLVALRRSLSGSVPILRKFMKAANLVENRASELIALGVLLPTLCEWGESLAGAATPTAASAGPLKAGLAGTAVTGLLLGAMYAIRVGSRVIDSLILLSPFFIVDIGLHGIRIALLGVIVAIHALNPWLSIALSLALVALCVLIAGWCIRLNMFASCIAWDVLTLRWRRLGAEQFPMRAFMASGDFGPPIRTRGRLRPDGDELRFEWNPWFVLPRRSISVTLQEPTLVKGLVWSTLATRLESRERDVVVLPPRYNGHHSWIAAGFRATPRDGLLRRGLRAAIGFVASWFREPRPNDGASGSRGASRTT